MSDDATINTNSATGASVFPNVQPMRNWLHTTRGHFGTIVKKAATIKKLNQVLHATLQKKMQPHCRVANFRDHKLMLQIDAATWATQIIYLLPDILSHFQSVCPEFKFLQVDYFVEPFFFKEDPNE
jgi:hypothetical protein